MSDNRADYEKAAFLLGLAVAFLFVGLGMSSEEGQEACNGSTAIGLLAAGMICLWIGGSIYNKRSEK